MSLISRLHHIFQGTREGGYDGTIMEFEDPEVKKYLVENIGGENGITNPDFGVEGVKGIAGEVTYEQVLACKKVDFSSNKNIRRFNELEYFKNLSTVNFGKSSIEEVSLPYMTISDSQIFNHCKKLKKLTTRYGLKINNGTELFSSCTSLQSLDTSRWDLSNLESAEGMFIGCESLQSLGDTSRWNLSNLKNGGVLFSSCTSLQSLDISRWDLSNLESAEGMFSGCESLSSLDLSRWNLSKLRNARNMFNGCTNLETLVGNHTETDNVRLFINYDFTSINFKYCPKINLATINAVIRGVGRNDWRLAISLPEPVKSQVTEEYKKILESKNWKII